jgi:7tm Odorant receptor
MFERSTPFRQFTGLFKIYGFEPSAISRRHKIAACFMFIVFEFIHGFMVILPIFQNKESATFWIEFIFQSPFVILTWFKMIYYFKNFSSMEKFKQKMCKIFNNNEGNFNEAFRTSKKVSLFVLALFMTIATSAAILPLLTNLLFIVFWKPIDMNEDLYFYVTWIQETVGIFYNMLITNLMYLYPLCIMIMLQAYLKNLNQQFRSATNKQELIKCVSNRQSIKSLIEEFQIIFSPLFFSQALAITISLGATLMFLTSKVSSI